MSNRLKMVHDVLWSTHITNELLVEMALPEVHNFRHYVKALAGPDPDYSTYQAMQKLVMLLTPVIYGIYVPEGARKIEKVLELSVEGLQSAPDAEAFRQLYREMQQPLAGLLKEEKERKQAGPLSDMTRLKNALSENQVLRQRVAELEALQNKCAKEFPLTAQGAPDVANLHANICQLKKATIRRT